MRTVDRSNKPLQEAVYLTSDCASSWKIIGDTIYEMKRSGANTLLIDVKDESGQVRFPVDSKLARSVGALNCTIPLPMLVSILHREGIKCAVKICAFKDRKLAAGKGSLQMKFNKDDPRFGSAMEWVDPANPEVINYNIWLALQMVKMGVDEIQFDYVRYLETDGIDTHGRTKEEIIASFLKQARFVLKQSNPNVTLSIDAYAAIACKDGKPTAVKIGQNFLEIAKIVDRINLMAYPSHFYSEGRYGNPADYPREMVLKVSVSSQELLKDNHRIELGLMLQAFEYKNREYPFGCEYVKDQLESRNGIQYLYCWNPGKISPDTFEAIRSFNEDIDSGINGQQVAKLSPPTPVPSSKIALSSKANDLVMGPVQKRSN